MSQPITPTTDVGTSSLSVPMHMNAIVEGELGQARGFNWPCAEEVLHGVPGERYSFIDHDGDHTVWATQDGLSAHIRLYGGGLSMHVAAEEAIAIYEFRDKVLSLAPRVELDDEDPRVPVAFWSLTPHGPSNRSRMLTVPTWDEVTYNYTGETQLGLHKLMTAFTPGAGGQLLVWHGPPGTGKTSALRALAWEWRKWCSIHVVTDPETFFGSSAAYMLDVLLHEDSGLVNSVPSGGPASPVEDRWRLLVAEDTGEMLSRDAKDRTGPGLARLLNAVDGLIGQGLRFMVLVTTNEEIKALHAAVSRPGRCAANVPFELFTEEEVVRWRADHGLRSRSPVRPVPLSDLYAELAGRETSDRREPARAGFA